METIKVMGSGGGLFIMDLTPEVEEKIEKGILTVIAETPREKKAREKAEAEATKQADEEAAAAAAAEEAARAEAAAVEKAMAAEKKPEA